MTLGDINPDGYNDLTKHSALNLEKNVCVKGCCCTSKAEINVLSGFFLFSLYSNDPAFQEKKHKKS